MIGAVEPYKVKYRIIKPDGRIRFAGTGKPSWFTLEDARKNAKKNDSIYEYNLKTMDKMWEVL